MSHTKLNSKYEKDPSKKITFFIHNPTHKDTLLLSQKKKYVLLFISSSNSGGSYTLISIESSDMPNLDRINLFSSKNLSKTQKNNKLRFGLADEKVRGEDNKPNIGARSGDRKSQVAVFW